MRRMYSEKGIIDTVNKGIEEGAISAGGVSPQQEAVLDLMESDTGKLGIYSNGVLMSDANGDNINFDFYIDEDNVATINSDFPINLNTQAGVTINSQPVLTGKKLILDFENGQNKEISEAVYNDINNKVYDYIIVKNYKNTDADITLVLNTLTGTDADYCTISSLSYAQTAGIRQLSISMRSIVVRTSPYTVSLSVNDYTIPIVKRVLLTGASGTLSNRPTASYPEPLQFYYQVSSGNIFAPIVWETFDSSQSWGVGYATVYASVSDATPTKYKITYEGYNWTATAV